MVLSKNMSAVRLLVGILFVLGLLSLSVTVVHGKTFGEAQDPSDPSEVGRDSGQKEGTGNPGADFGSDAGCDDSGWCTTQGSATQSGKKKYVNPLSADVMSGGAPLTVTFSTKSYKKTHIDFGDGSEGKFKYPQGCPNMDHDDPYAYSGSCQLGPGTVTHTYQNDGTYVVKLLQRWGGASQGGVSVRGVLRITVGDGGGSSANTRSSAGNGNSGGSSANTRSSAQDNTNITPPTTNTRSAASATFIQNIAHKVQTFAAGLTGASTPSLPESAGSIIGNFQSSLNSALHGVFFNLLKPENDNTDYSNLPALRSGAHQVTLEPFHGSKFNTDDIRWLFISTDEDAACPAVAGSDHGYTYDLTYIGLVRGQNRFMDTTLSRTICGAGGEELTYVREVAADLERNHSFADIDVLALHKKTTFAGTDDDDDSTPAATVLEEPSSNEIGLEVKVTDRNGVLVSDWSGNGTTIMSTDELAFRWDATEYSQCLTFLADNGQYSLSKDNGTLVTGNTEAEGFNIYEQTKVYRVECNNQDNGEIGVDVGYISIIVDDDNRSTAASACPTDAMQCSDGSYVGRTGPSCAFAACPLPEDDLLSADPVNGSAPLEVTFNSEAIEGVYFGGVVLDFGDGNHTPWCEPAGSCAPKSDTYTYSAPGEYTAILKGLGEFGPSPILGRTTITVYGSGHSSGHGGETDGDVSASNNNTGDLGLPSFEDTYTYDHENDIWGTAPPSEDTCVDCSVAAEENPDFSAIGLEAEENDSSSNSSSNDSGMSPDTTGISEDQENYGGP